MAEIIINTKDEMIQLARDLAAKTSEGDLICLYGDLGVGKSFFVRYFINALRDEECEVLSPTFNLVYSYESNRGQINHFDLYRLKSEEELENIGFFEVLRNSICLVEWPQIAEGYFDFPHVKIYIENVSEGQEESRKVTIDEVLAKSA